MDCHCLISSLCSVRIYYGPDALTSSFDADTCAVQLGLPTCAFWQPDPYAVVKFITHEAPGFLGGWCLVGIIAASMSTASGAVLAMGTVMSHNVARQLDRWYPSFITEANLLRMCRLATIPTTIAAALIACLKPDKTGYFLIVAFDIVLASTVIPLLGCFYTKNPSPRAALMAVIGGSVARITLEFSLPKDGLLLLPFPGEYFLDFGPAASSLLPSFMDVDPSEHWNPEVQPCKQETLRDFTGVDSLAAPVVALVIFVLIQYFENRVYHRSLFSFPGDAGYEKYSSDASAKDTEPTRHDPSSSFEGEASPSPSVTKSDAGSDTA
jgi:hypothetical protein